MNIKGRDIDLKLDSKNEPNNKEKDKNRYKSQKLENNLQNYRENTRIDKKNLENKPQNYKESTRIHKEYKESIKKNKELIKKNKMLYNTIRTLCLNDNDFMELDAIARIVQNKKDLQIIKGVNDRKSVIVTDVDECYKQLKIENKELKKLEQKLRTVRKYDELLKYFECNSNFNSKEKRLSFYNQNVDIILKDGKKLDSYDKIKICVRQAILHNLSNAKKIRILTDKNNFNSSRGSKYSYEAFAFQRDSVKSPYKCNSYNFRYDDDGIVIDDTDDDTIYMETEAGEHILPVDFDDFYSYDTDKNLKRHVTDVINLQFPDFKDFTFPELDILIYNNSDTYQPIKILAFLSFQWIIDKTLLSSSRLDSSAEAMRLFNHLKYSSNHCLVNSGYDIGYYQGVNDTEPQYYFSIGICFCNNTNYYDFEEIITRNLQEVYDLVIELNKFQLGEKSRYLISNKKISIFFEHMYENLNLTTEPLKKLITEENAETFTPYMRARDFLFKLYKKRCIAPDIKSLNIKNFYEYNNMCMIMFDNIYANDILSAIILFKEDLSLNFCYLEKLDLDFADKSTYIDICNIINKSKGWVTYEVIDKDDLSYLLILGDPLYYNWNEKLEKDMFYKIADEFKWFYNNRLGYIGDYIYF